MNPELLRNLWLEATLFRLSLIAGFLLLVFVAAKGGAFPADVAGLVLYWFFVVLWGTRSAALAVVGEIRERTWDGQKLSAIGPVDMVWGKLFGATVHNWFGGLICLPAIVLPMSHSHGAKAAVTYGLILVALGVLAQAVALLSSLMLIHRRTGNWRLDTFLCQVTGIMAAFSYYSLWSSGAAYTRTLGGTVSWWGHDFNLAAFHLLSLLCFTGWALVGCWRAMRSELRFTNGPFVWLAWLLYIAVYHAGFESFLNQKFFGPYGGDYNVVSMRLALAGLALLASCYGMVFLEPKNPVRFRWLMEQVQAGHGLKAFMALDAWMLSYGATLLVGGLLAVSLTFDGLVAGHPGAGLAVVALLGFLTRDIGIFVMLRGNRGDFAALATLGALYILGPLIFQGMGLGGLSFLFLPVLGSGAFAGVAAAWIQGLVALWLAARSMRAVFTAR